MIDMNKPVEIVWSKKKVCQAQILNNQVNQLILVKYHSGSVDYYYVFDKSGKAVLSLLYGDIPLATLRNKEVG
ncbi:MAG TPA: hypothetical protein HA367_01295 [Candidatus Methanofastidiosum sp.]|nr:hypothetical protein [Methanofastidiosum sp.]